MEIPHLKAFFTAFTALFVALDVVGTLPVYFSLTSRLEPGERRRIVDRSMWIALLTAVGFVFLGQGVFRFLGIQIADFRIAGGLVLLLISLADLVGKPEHENRVTGSSGIVPLAVPLITGPGVLTTLILQVGLFGYGLTLAALVANYAIAWVILRKSDSIHRLLGNDGAVVLSKLAALLLAAIAVSMIRGGLVEALAGAFSSRT